MRKKNLTLEEKEERFEEIWKRYPVKKGKHNASLKFKYQVNTEEDWQNIQKALVNYIADVERIRRDEHRGRRFQNGSTWFNHYWEDYVDMGNEKEAEKQEDNEFMEKVVNNFKKALSLPHINTNQDAYELLWNKIPSKFRDRASRILMEKGYITSCKRVG